MNFSFTSSLQLPLQIIEQSFSDLSARFVMAHKACFKTSYEKFSEALTGDKPKNFD